MQSQKEPDGNNAHNFTEYGQFAYKLAEELWPICRSITGAGVRETLAIIAKRIQPKLRTYSMNTGTKCFDWTIPMEWEIKDAWIKTSNGEKIVDFKKNNLHVVGYSTAIDSWISRKDLDEHIYSLPEQPNAIPYVTSYYKKRWGFCMTEQQRQKLAGENYHVFIDSNHYKGHLNYGEVIIKGESKKEIFFSTYICHPSLANNELSGPVVATQLINWIHQRGRPKYTCRFIFIPETIGSIAYLSKNLKKLKKNVIAAYNLTCLGDDRTFSFLPSKNGNSLSDIAAKHVLKALSIDFKEYKWIDRGSDERQYCAPGVDLPVSSVMRSKYGEYPEYHTSLDNLELISSNGLGQSIRVIAKIIQALEINFTPKMNVLCEPQLGKRGLYPDLSKKDGYEDVALLENLITYSDGSSTLFEIAEKLNTSIFDLEPIADLLRKEKLI